MFDADVIRREMAIELRQVSGSQAPQHEQRYAALYQQLVTAGLAPQLRKKYRP